MRVRVRGLLWQWLMPIAEHYHSIFIWFRSSSSIYISFNFNLFPPLLSIFNNLSQERQGWVKISHKIGQRGTSFAKTHPNSYHEIVFALKVFLPSDRRTYRSRCQSRQVPRLTWKWQVATGLVKLTSARDATASKKTCKGHRSVPPGQEVLVFSIDGIAPGFVYCIMQTTS